MSLAAEHSETEPPDPTTSGHDLAEVSGATSGAVDRLADRGLDLLIVAASALYLWNIARALPQHNAETAKESLIAMAMLLGIFVAKKVIPRFDPLISRWINGRIDQYKK